MYQKNQVIQEYNIKLEDENKVISEILPLIAFDNKTQENIINRSKNLMETIREDHNFSIESFLQKFSLSTEEGVAIMCLAEGLLRIPDRDNAIELMLDKLSNKQWNNYLSLSDSMTSSFASYGLFASGYFADTVSGINNKLLQIVSKVGKNIFLSIIKQAIEFLSKQFIFGNTIQQALSNTKKYTKNRFSFDLLGESSRTIEQSEKYFNQYLDAIEKISASEVSKSASINDIYQSSNLSVKLTALYPRLEYAKKSDIDNYLIPILVELISKIRENNLTITFDAEEASRLDIYLYTIKQILYHEKFKDFAGIGVVMQAYQTRMYKVIDFIIDIAKDLNHKIPIRLVKGAYWDFEIKKAQEYGLDYYPVFTKKEYTDVSYIACAKKILENHQYIFPQFATHNALTTASIIELSKDIPFEFQKLHGMGNILHDELQKLGYVTRIYAPIGHMNDLLAYLMRRMLENGANSCFVNKIKNNDIALDKLAYNLYEVTNTIHKADNSKMDILLPKYIFGNRISSYIYDLGYKNNFDFLNQEVSKLYYNSYSIGSIINGVEIVDKHKNKKELRQIIEKFSPSCLERKVSDITIANETDIKNALEITYKAFDTWSATNVKERSRILNKIADIYDQNKIHLYALLINEAGKNITDAMAEVAEAIDFCRYYAEVVNDIFTARNMKCITGEINTLSVHPRGVFLCISPWNFPLAIFTGQIVAALVCGNTVLAKPAEQTSVIANVAVKLMHEAGVPKDVLNLIIAPGSDISKHVIASNIIAGVAFTGSNNTAQKINITLANRSGAIASFIAETGGQNAMIVDSSALLEQVTDDIITSAFGSAGQRCSALRVVYIQDEIYEPLLNLIKGAMSLLKVSDTRDFSTDIGPVIDDNALNNLSNHIIDMVEKGFNIVAKHDKLNQENKGHFFYPHIISINSINDIQDEKFGPILHVIKYKNKDLDKIISEINNYGYGLTFGIHSRITSKIDHIVSKVKVGNIYVNRSMIGARVESQPFGGENKSGTGFKAGGPNYLLRFIVERTLTLNLTAIGGNIELLNKKFDI